MDTEILKKLFTVDKKIVYTPIATLIATPVSRMEKPKYFNAVMDTKQDAIIVESNFDHVVQLVIDSGLKFWNRDLKNIGKVAWSEKGFSWEPALEFKEEFPAVFLFGSPDHHYKDMFAAEITMAGEILYKELLKTHPNLERSEFRYRLDPDL